MNRVALPSTNRPDQLRGLLTWPRQNGLAEAKGVEATSHLLLRRLAERVAGTGIARDVIDKPRASPRVVGRQGANEPCGCVAVELLDWQESLVAIGADVVGTDAPSEA